MTQSPGELASRIIVDFKNIKKVNIFIPRQALLQPGCDSYSVVNSINAKMNIRFVVAYCLIHHGEKINFNPPYEKKVLDLMKLCTLIENPSATMTFPERIPASIEIELENGLIRQDLEDFHTLSDDEDLERFRNTLSKNEKSFNINQIVETILN